MNASDLIALTERLLLSAGLEHGIADDRSSIVVRAGDDVAIFISVLDAPSEDELPVFSLAIPLIQGIETDDLSALDLATFNHEIGVGKLAFDPEERMLLLEHEMPGWPGGAEYRAALDYLVGNASAFHSSLAPDISGKSVVTYSEIVED